MFQAGTFNVCVSNVSKTFWLETFYEKPFQLKCFLEITSARSVFDTVSSGSGLTPSRWKGVYPFHSETGSQQLLAREMIPDCFDSFPTALVTTLFDDRPDLGLS